MHAAGFLLCARRAWGWGRAAVAEETAWLMDVVMRALQTATAYLGSEFVGDLTLLQLVQSA